MATRPTLPIRTRSEMQYGQATSPLAREFELVDRTMGLDDPPDQSTDASDSDWQDIDPYWRDGDNVRNLESMMTDIESRQRPSQPELQVTNPDCTSQVDRMPEDGVDLATTRSPVLPSSTQSFRPESNSAQPIDRDASKLSNLNSTSTTFSPESADALALRLSNEFSPLREKDWDTVVYIGPPPQQHGQTSDEYEYITQHFSRPYLMRSQTLRASGSAEFRDRLGPKSARAMRKLKNLGLHLKLPSDGQAKYWIDLRPMQNDDEAAQTVSELTCTPGILEWHKVGAHRSIDSMLIKGKDKMNVPLRLSQEFDISQETVSDSVSSAQSSNASAIRKITPDDDLEPDYSPLRHHSAVERLLHALAGNNPRVNSAPKMWTFFAVAKLLDCARHIRVADEIYSWLFAGYNSEFIEVNPEVCYRIAMGIQNKMLLRVTFCILVGERAMNQACQTWSASSTAPLTRNTTQVRRLCYLDDDEDNRIDHAARCLSRRVISVFSEMVRQPMTWLSKSTELFKLLALIGITADAKALLIHIKDLLYKHVSNEIVHSLAQNLVSRPNESHENDFNILRTYSKATVEGYNRLPLPQRLLSQLSWTFFKHYTFCRDNGSLQPTGEQQWEGHTEIGSGTLARIWYERRSDFEMEIGALNLQIGQGNIRYESIQGHEQHQSDYEIRWDAVYSAARRNLPNLQAGYTSMEYATLEKTISDRERDHQRDVQEYDRLRATQTTSQLDVHIPKSALADNYYTGAKINAFNLLSQLSSALNSRIDADLLRPGYLKDACGPEADIAVKTINTLLCLDDDEFKFLPLWADGCEDGTGGVYTEAVPGALDEGFQGGKRGLDDTEGLQDLADVEMGDSFSMIDTQEAESTVAGASRVATAGVSANSVMSMDE